MAFMTILSLYTMTTKIAYYNASWIKLLIGYNFLNEEYRNTDVIFLQNDGSKEIHNLSVSVCDFDSMETTWYN